MGLLTSLITGLASGEAYAALRRARLAAILYSLAGLCCLCGIGFLIGAAFIWSERHFGPMASALGFGIGFLVLAGVFVLAFRISGSSRRRRREKRRKADMTAIGVSTALALLPTLLRGKGRLSLLASPIVALAAYAIYRENAGRHNDDDRDSGAGI
ncbi:hypothetical protein [Mesorhizobium sp. SP-1A]|uniref:hypothetical protein n=1 Tax=Mesorhizobium sp. SP-1A TaxID=3077840 RepID=UPI0028F74381|nr:hypothetical protein [Mesorhizobium sp. SP-1A]